MKLFNYFFILYFLAMFVMVVSGSLEPSVFQQAIGYLFAVIHFIKASLENK